MAERGYKTVYLNEKLSVGLAPEGIREYAVQRTRWCQGLVQICRGKSSPLRFNNNLPFLYRINLVETFLYWAGSFAFRMSCMIVPALFFLFDVRVVQASVSDAIVHFAPMMITQIAVTIWLGGGRMLPMISDVYQMLVAPEIIKVVALTLLRPHGHRFNVTAKGIHHAGLNIQWRLLARFFALAAITILGLIKIFVIDNSDLVEQGGTLNVLWAWYNLLVLTICCLVCIEQPRRRADERFPTKERAIVRIGDEVRIYDVTDVSAGGMRLTGAISGNVGSPVNVIMTNFESGAFVARKGNNEFALSLLGSEAREAMTRRVYSEQYCKPIDRISASQVFAGILQRLAQ